MRKPILCALLPALLLAAVARADDAPYKISNASFSPRAGIFESHDTPQGPVCDQPVSLPADNIVLGLDFTISPQFDDAHTSLTLKASDVKIDGFPTPPTFLGTWKSVGEFAHADAITIARPADWATRANKSFAGSFQYAVPKSVLGQQAVPVTINGTQFKLNVFSSLQQLGGYQFVKYNSMVDFAVMADSLPCADASKPPLTNPNGKLVVFRAELGFQRGTDAVDVASPVKVAYNSFNLAATLKDKSTAVTPLLGFIDPQGKFVPVDPRQTIQGAASGDKPLTRAHKFVFAVSNDLDPQQTVQMRLFNIPVVVENVSLPVPLVKTEAVLEEVVPEFIPYKEKTPYTAGKMLTAPEGKKYLRVTAHVIPPLLPNQTNVALSLNAKVFRLTDDKGAVIPQLGGWNDYGIIGGPGDPQLHSFGAKYDGTTPCTFNRIFLVPADAKQLTFELYYQKSTIPMPTATDKLDASNVLSFTIKSAKIVDSILDYSNPDGKTLLVTAEWAYKKRTDMAGGNEGSLHMFHSLLNVLPADPNAKPAPCMAELSMDGKTIQGLNKNGNSNSMQSSQTYTPDPSHSKTTTTFIFPVPANFTTFDLTYAGWKVASGTASN